MCHRNIFIPVGAGCCLMERKQHSIYPTDCHSRAGNGCVYDDSDGEWATTPEGRSIMGIPWRLLYRLHSPQRECSSAYTGMRQGCDANAAVVGYLSCFSWDLFCLDGSSVLSTAPDLTVRPGLSCLRRSWQFLALSAPKHICYNKPDTFCFHLGGLAEKFLEQRFFFKA